eukprot:825590_1
MNRSCSIDVDCQSNKMVSPKRLLLTSRQCLLLILLLAIPITLISIRELEHHDYDLSYSAQLPVTIIEVPSSSRNIKQTPILNKSDDEFEYHAHNANDISESMADVILN